MKIFVIFLVLIGIVAMPFTTQYVLAHTVHCGMFGCPVGAYGITDWDLYKTASDSMFKISLVAYGLLATLFCYYLRKRISIFTIVRK
jgi:hypothetical protein